MTKSNLFKAAHKLAREYRDFFSCYAMAFSFALKEVYAMTKESEKNIYESRYEAAVVKANADADALKVDDFNRSSYVRSDVRSILGAYDMTWKEIKSRMEWDTLFTKEERIFTIMCLMHSPTYDGVESIPADATPPQARPQGSIRRNEGRS